MNFARWLFLISGVWGLAVLIPHYFMEQSIAKQHPPAITHPEFFYGFTGVALAWQFVFLIIGSDPLRFRPMMLPSALEKFSFAAATIALYAAGRVSTPVLSAGLIDLLFGALFAVAWWRLGDRVAVVERSEPTAR
jgi:hypothetical protein